MFSLIFTRSWLKEILFAILVAATTFSIALLAYNWELRLGIKPSFYQSYYEPAVRMACGQPFGIDPSGKMTDEMRRFLKTEQQALSCESVIPVQNLERNPQSRVWYYQFVASAQIWKITGISWPALEGFSAVLLAIAAIMVYALFRLFMPIPIAATLAVVSILPGLRILPYLRDMSKAPFILAGLFVTVWLVVRTPTRLRLCSAMAALGVWLGIGYGFRPDVLIVLPLLIVTIFFFRPVPLKTRLLDGVLATVILSGTFIAAASPVFSAFNANVGSCTWHVALLGLSEFNTRLLGVLPADYSLLVHYHDDFVWSSVESYGERVLSLPSVGYCTSLYDQASKALYFDLFRTFPGDFMTRGLATAQQVIGSGFWGFPWDKLTPTLDAFFASNRAFIQGAFIGGWAAIVLIALARNVRVGLFSIFALAYLGSYPVIQFELRHYFHITFLTWLPAGIAMAWVTRTENRNLGAWIAAIRSLCPAAWIRAISILITMIVIGCAVYLGVRHYQTTAVRRLFEHYLKATGGEAVVSSKYVQEDNAILTISAPERSGQNMHNGRMLRLDIGGPNCTSGAKKIAVELSGPDPGYAFKKEFVFNFSPFRPHATVFVPAYFQQQRLTTLSLVLPQQNVGCVEHATWLRSGELPSLWMLATLYPDWRESRLYQLK